MPRRLVLTLALAAGAFLLSSAGGGPVAPGAVQAAPQRALLCSFVDPCVLTVSVSGGGTVSGAPGVSCTTRCVEGPFLAKAVKVSLTASPAPGFAFAGWGGACSGAGACAFSLSTDALVTASFLPVLTVSVAGQGKVTGGGISCPTDCAQSFGLNAGVTLNAAPAANFRFDGWSGNCAGTGACTLTMSAPRSVVATFSQITRRLSISRSGSGRVTGSPGGLDCGSICAVSLAQGTSVTLTATAEPGREFAGWSGACSGTSPTCTLTLDADKTVAAAFRDVPARLTVNRTGQGSVTSAPAGISCGGSCAFDYLKGTTVTLSAAPAAGAFFAGWGGACSGASQTCVVTLESARTVTAAFRTPAVMLTDATIRAKWRRSKATGTLVVAGAATDGGEIEIVLGSGPPVSLSLASGRFRRVLPLPDGLLPGRYPIRVAGTSHGIKLAAVERRVVLKAPPEGVVGEGVVSLSAGGAAVATAPRGTKELFARFRFAARPTAICKVTTPPAGKKSRRRRVCTPRPTIVSWLHEGRVVGKPVKKRGARTVASFVRSNVPLPDGLWRAVIRVSGVVVMELEVRVGGDAPA